MSFIGELKRRNVVRVGFAYAVIGWVLAQIAEFAFDNFGAPDWVLKSFVVLLLLGLPLALFFAWAFEITPEGIKREKDVDRSESITSHTGQPRSALAKWGENRRVLAMRSILKSKRLFPRRGKNGPSSTPRAFRSQ